MLKAGFSRVDITPPLGTPMAGYFYAREAEGVLDPLFLNALALSDGENKALVIAADILGIDSFYTDQLRERISEKTDVAADHVMITALHQHTSVFVKRPSGDKNLDFGVVQDQDYLNFLFRRFLDVAVMALDDLKESTLETASKETSVPLSFIRRYYMKDGSVATNPGRCHPDLVDHAGEADNTVRLIRFRRKDTSDIACLNFSTHPDVVSGEKFSADWPGYTRKYFEEALPDVSCIFINGAQGDANHINFFVEKQWDDRYEYCRFMGMTVAKTALSIWENTDIHNNHLIFGGIKVIKTPTRTDGAERYAECLAFFNGVNEGRIKSYHITEIADAKRVVMMRDQPFYRSVPVSVIGVGDVAIVGFSGEPFTVYAKRARESARDKFVIAACCANGYSGYLPSEAAFSEGGYESSSSHFTPAVEQECTNAAKELLDQF